MSAPPSHGSSHTDSKKHDSYAAASKEIKQDQASESQQDDDKDGKQQGQDGKEEGTSSQVGGPSHASKSTAAPSLDEKIPEPGFDAPEDKMQGDACLTSCSAPDSNRDWHLTYMWETSHLVNSHLCLRATLLPCRHWDVMAQRGQ